MQVDRFSGISSSLGIKAPVVAATTGPITLSGLQTVDGVMLLEGERVLVKDQVDLTQNGIYTASNGTWSRSLDFDGPEDAIEGTAVLVTRGNTNGTGAFYVFTSGAVIGQTVLYFMPSLARETQAQMDAAAARALAASGSASAASGSASAASGSAAAAAISAASVSLPTLGTAHQRLRVNAAGNAMEYGITAGEVIQTVYTTNSTATASSAVIPPDGTIPQSGEGVQLMSQAITPKLASSKIRVSAVVHIGSSAGPDAVIALFKDAGADALSVSYAGLSGTGSGENVALTLRYYENAVDTTSRTYALRFGPDSTGAIYANAIEAGTAPFGAGMLVSSLTVEEIAG